MNNLPLVSILVVTYNSSKYIIETLDSAKLQTYKRLELIITDDASQDDTLELCQKWLIENENRFESVKIITSEINTGVTLNANRGLKSCTGKYIKGIAGDDLLLSNCVSDFTDFFEKNPHINVSVSKVEVFFDDNPNQTFIWPTSEFKVEHHWQWQQILKGNFIYTITTFRRNSYMKEVDYFDEKYTMIEDYPFVYKVLKRGDVFYFLDKLTVRHRVNYYSITRPLKSGRFVNPLMQKQVGEFIRENILPELRKKKWYVWYFLRWSKLWIIDKIVENGNSPNKSDNFFLHKFLFLNKRISARLIKYNCNL